MLKYLRNKSIVIAAFLCFGSAAAAPQGSCLYQRQKESKPAQISSAVALADSKSYLLKDGAFLSVVTWDCQRIGKRLLLEMPASVDREERVASIVGQIAGEEVRGALLSASKGSWTKYGHFTFDLSVRGVEHASVEIDRNEYGSRYVVLYYTSD